MINVQFIDMPCKIHGAVRENEDGSVTILLNSRDSRERNLKAYQHELKHILRDDLHSEEDIQLIEARAHAE